MGSEAREKSAGKTQTQMVNQTSSDITHGDFGLSGCRKGEFAIATKSPWDISYHGIDGFIDNIQNLGS